jgi:hypothetical protein
LFYVVARFSESEKDALASRVAKLEKSTGEQAALLKTMREAHVPHVRCSNPVDFESQSGGVSKSRTAEEGFGRSGSEGQADPPTTTTSVTRSRSSATDNKAEDSNGLLVSTRSALLTSDLSSAALLLGSTTRTSGAMAREPCQNSADIVAEDQTDELPLPSGASKATTAVLLPHGCGSVQQKLTRVLEAMRRAKHGAAFGGRIAKDCESSARTKLRVVNALQVLKMIAEHEADDANTTSTMSTLFASLDDDEDTITAADL